MKKWIKSTRVIVNGKIMEAAVAFENEIITDIVTLDQFEDDDEVVDYGDDVIMAAIVDTHAHINEPGRTDWEGFETATKAALAGGICSVIDMPLNSIPATTSLSALRIKRESALSKCSIDYGFWGGVIPGNQSELEPMVRDGAFGFKAFMCESGVPEFPYSKNEDLKKAMVILKDLDVPLLVHAEVEMENPAHSHDHSLYSTYLCSRPKEWEDEAIRRIIKLVEETKCRTHIVHLSSAQALKYIDQAKQKNLPLTVETCPHYLSLNSEDIEKGSTHFKCAPPIREQSNQDELWKAVKNGLIDFIVSDHSPCTPDLKLLDKGDFMKAWGGIASIQFSLPVVWTEMRNHGLDVTFLSEKMSRNTSRFCGIEKQCGTIEIGKKANLLVFAPEENFTLTQNMIHHKHKLTPYLGRSLYGVVKHVWLRGNLQYTENEFVTPGQGKEISKK